MLIQVLKKKYNRDIKMPLSNINVQCLLNKNVVIFFQSANFAQSETLLLHRKTTILHQHTDLRSGLVMILGNTYVNKMFLLSPL